jgi:N-sulfoglucosamine sulfohydrolase
VPLIIHWPKNFREPAHFKAGAVDDRLIAAIDFVPTMLAIAGVARPAAMEGRCFLGERADPPREYVFGARDRCDETYFRIRTVRDARYRYIRNFTPEKPFLSANAYKDRSYPAIAVLKEMNAAGTLTPPQQALCASTMPAEELYDLATDPYEIKNLVDSPEQHETLERLRGALSAWIEQSPDLGASAEPAAVMERQGLTRPGGKPAQPAIPRPAPR